MLLFGDHQQTVQTPFVVVEFAEFSASFGNRRPGRPVLRRSDFIQVLHKREKDPLGESRIFLGQATSSDAAGLSKEFITQIRVFAIIDTDL